ncbi:hypothetical protein [Shimia biformata]|uniref:hypothetical protein n=1 Tax=Shimia biformata TaxID=1294299 RepID=UPI00195187D0|nr:hypothetical protein [Shimia biformata]
MLGLLRLIFFGFIFLTIVYVIVSAWSRSVRRGKLKTWWEEEGRPGDLETYVEQGLKEYDGSLRRKLIWGVYIVPTVLVVTIVYVTNFM